MRLYGISWLLGEWGAATIVVLILVCLSPLLVIRERTEGVPYGVAISSMFGIPLFLGACSAASHLFVRALVSGHMPAPAKWERHAAVWLFVVISILAVVDTYRYIQCQKRLPASAARMLLVYLLAALILVYLGYQERKRGGGNVFLTSLAFQYLSGAASLLASVLYVTVVGWGATAGNFHATVAFPLLVFPALNSIPIVVSRGNSGERWVTFAAGVLFLVLVVSDQATGRADEPGFFFSRWKVSDRARPGRTLPLR